MELWEHVISVGTNASRLGISARFHPHTNYSNDGNDFQWRKTVYRPGALAKEYSASRLTPTPDWLSCQTYLKVDVIPAFVTLLCFIQFYLLNQSIGSYVEDRLARTEALKRIGTAFPFSSPNILKGAKRDLSGHFIFMIRREALDRLLYWYKLNRPIRPVR